MPTQTIDPSTPPVPQPGPARPTEYSEEIGMTICERLIEGESLRAICTDPNAGQGYDVELDFPE